MVMKLTVALLEHGLVRHPGWHSTY